MPVQQTLTFKKYLIDYF